MIDVRKSEERGHFDHGWLDTYHTFSFADYFDPDFMGFRTLRVINEDRVQPGLGFGTHGHQDMEIITVVLEGALEHKDSMGSKFVVRPGEVQRMTAGTGVRHSEVNPSRKEPVHLYQIWILPERKGLKPEYEQKEFPAEDRKGNLRLLASGDGRNGSLRIHQDVDLYATLLKSGQKLSHAMRPGRHAWVQVAKGALSLNGQPLRAGDGAAVSGKKALELAATDDAEVLMFDLN